ncbi:MAG: hypothetical protein SGJ24_04385 [Chloroflexota bacterium]|nr:hypothetical protein [Chloroflexota bacterium]
MSRAPAKPEYVQLEPGEDASSARDRLGFLRGRRVLLIWPESGTALSRRLDLVLVQREAMRLAITLALVTHDSAVTQHAHDLNISTFETIGASERGKWKRGRAKVFTSRSQKPKDEREPDELIDVASRLKDETLTPRQRRARTLTRAGLALLVSVGAAGAVYAVLPSATVTIVPLRQTVEVMAEVRAVPGDALMRIDVENGLIPALVVRAQVEERATIPASGMQQVSASRATGTVVFINKTDNAVTVPADSFVGTSAGTPILFRTMTEALVPAGRGLQIEVPIEAVEEVAGEIGNVDGGLINTLLGPVAEQIEVRNISPTFGGERRTIGAVSAQDHEYLIAILRQQIQDRAFDEMQPRLETNQFLIGETIGIAEERDDWMIFSHPVGAVTDEVTLTMRAIVQATAVDQDLANQVAFARLAGQIPRSFVIDPGSIAYTRGAVERFDPDGAVNFTVRASGVVSSQIDPWTIQQNLAGRADADALAYLDSALELAPGTLPQIARSPDWLPHLPLLPGRIRLLLVSL